MPVDRCSIHHNGFQGSTKLSPVCHMVHWNLVTKKAVMPKKESYGCTEPSKIEDFLTRQFCASLRVSSTNAQSLPLNEETRERFNKRENVVSNRLFNHYWC